MLRILEMKSHKYWKFFMLCILDNMLNSGSIRVAKTGQSCEEPSFVMGGSQVLFLCLIFFKNVLDLLTKYFYKDN